MTGKTVTVRFLHPESADILTLQLPADTRFGALPALLYDADFLRPQKAGYRFLLRGHLCEITRTLADYLPADGAELELRVFDLPMIMV